MISAQVLVGNCDSLIGISERDFRLTHEVMKHGSHEQRESNRSRIRALASKRHRAVHRCESAIDLSHAPERARHLRKAENTGIHVICSEILALPGGIINRDGLVEMSDGLLVPADEAERDAHVGMRGHECHLALMLGCDRKSSLGKLESLPDFSAYEVVGMQSPQRR